MGYPFRLHYLKVLWAVSLYYLLGGWSGKTARKGDVNFAFSTAKRIIISCTNQENRCFKLWRFTKEIWRVPSRGNEVCLFFMGLVSLWDLWRSNVKLCYWGMLISGCCGWTLKTKDKFLIGKKMCAVGGRINNIDNSITKYPPNKIMCF